jgi:hypothetical protein
MRLRRVLRLGLVSLALPLLIPGVAQGQSGIAGVAKDATGAVLPGVTVEASSDVLIEKTRTVLTDDAGVYRIVDLRPGTYAVTFTLEGFNSFKRDDLELPANFTATVNAEMRVGSIEESVTVSGQSPVVDLQSAATQQVLPRSVLDAIPTGRSIWATGQLVPGVTLSAPDVGGSRGMQQVYMAVHGSDTRDNTQLVDGLRMNSFDGDGNVQAYYNDLMFEEINYQTSAISAESAGAGVRYNMIPKDGGNTFKGTLLFNVQPGQWSSDNSTPALVAQGLAAAQKLIINRDLNGALGGPILKDRLWFFFSARRWGVDSTIPNAFYNLDPTHRTFQPDLSHQVVDDNLIKSGLLRLTYRAGPHKLAAYIDSIVKFRGHEGTANLTEEAYGVRYPKNFYTSSAKYTGTLTSRLLVEAGLSVEQNSYSTNDVEPSVQPGDIPRLEITGVPGGAPANASWSSSMTPRLNRFPDVSKVLAANLSYVTGSHAFKTGIQYGWGEIDRFQSLQDPVYLVQRYRAGVPDSVIVYNVPTQSVTKLKYDIGMYVQDSWAFKRLTVNPGIRFDFFDSYYPAQTSPAGRFAPARSFPAEPDSEQPHWKNWEPRFGIIYDLFGDTKTALKASVGKYVRTYTSGFSDTYNPVILSSDIRTWTDTNHDDIAQDSEIGPSNNSQFGIASAHAPAPGIKRPTNTEESVSIQRQVIPGMSISFGYTRRDYQNLIATQNIAVQPLGTPIGTGYTALQIPSPINPSEMLTVYNLNPALKSAVNLLDYNSPNDRRYFNAFDLQFQSRILGGTVFGGASWGQQILVNCDVQDPNYVSTTANGITSFGSTGLRYCDQSAFGMPYRSQFKVSGTYPLAYGIQVSGSFQSNAGGAATQNGGDQSLNEVYNLNATAFKALTGQTLTQTQVIAELRQPGTMYLPRINTTDIRFSKNLTVGKMRLQGHLGMFNGFNVSPITDITQTYGASYGKVNGILPARTVEIGGTLNF